MSILKILQTKNNKLRTSFANFLTFIRFSHTLFALPFALGAMIVAARGWPGWSLFTLIIGCMVFARTAAMSFNRIVDWEIDQRNPRTVSRHTLVSKPTAGVACAISAMLFMLTAGAINNLTLWLSPFALGTLFFYSLTKRFTHFAQIFLGLALGISPVGAWIAVTGKIETIPLLLAFGVVCWVAGFDMIYATQDVDVDREEGLYSMVVWLGVPRALQLAGWLHGLLFLVLLGFGLMAQLHYFYYFFLLPIPFLLFYEHRMAKTLQVELINRAFFQTNICLGFLFLLATIAGV